MFQSRCWSIVLVLISGIVAVVSGWSRPSRLPIVARVGESERTLQADLTRSGSTFNSALRFGVMGNSNSERGVTVTRQISEGETLISIPFESWGTSSRGEQTPTGVKMNTEAWASRGFSELDFLALWVLESDQESSYIRSLPQPEDLSHLPAFWPPLDRAYLNGTDLEAEVTERLVQYELGWSLILEADPAFCERVSLDEWKWAKAIVNSRAFGISVPSEQSGGSDEIMHALIPFVDMMNHRFSKGGCGGEYESQGVVVETDPASIGDDAGGDGQAARIRLPVSSMQSSCNSDWNFEHGDSNSQSAVGAFVVRSLQPIDFGQELTLSYGEFSEGESLLNYGFVAQVEDQEEQNYDFITIKVCLAEAVAGENNAGSGSIQDVNNSGRQFGTSRVRRYLGRSGTKLLRSINKNRLSKDTWLIQNKTAEDLAVDPAHEAAKADLWLRDEDCPYNLGVYSERCVTMSVGDEGPCSTLLSLLRVAVSTPSELKYLESRQDQPAANICKSPISRRNELAAHSALKRVLRRQQISRGIASDASTSGSKPDDETAMAPAPILNLNQMNANKIVHSENRILTHLLRVSEASMSYLAAKPGNKFSRGSDYKRLLKGTLRSSVRLE